MRNTTFDILSLFRCVARYPDEVCFAFNPNYIEIESEWKTATLTIEVAETRGNSSANKQIIKTSMRDGAAKIYMSRLFELLFENPRLHRSLEVVVLVKIGTILLFSFDTIVIWGNLAVGERFGAYGVYDHTSGKQYFERNLIWFKHFPFNVSLFRYNYDVEFLGRYDGGFYDKDPIYQDDKVMEFDVIDKFNSALTVVDSTASGGKVVYMTQFKRFVMLKDDKCYGSWTADAANNQGTQDGYCDINNSMKPLKDTTYLLRTNAGFERYRFVGDELECFGIYAVRGFKDISAQHVFPKATRSATIKYKISDEDRRTSVFDRTFDYTFFQTGENVALVNLTVSNETSGHYLRWIDRQGNLQYFLFKKGKISHKNKLGSDIVADDFDVNGMYFANHVRTRSLDCSVTMKCCAVNLPKDIYDYVVTILSAPIVDLYRGKDEFGEEIWQPVNIQSSTADYDPKKILNDLEFTFAIPDVNSQSL